MVDHKPHFDAGKHQESAEYVEYPFEFVNQACAHTNHDGTQHDHAHNAPEQNAVLIFAWNGEKRKDQRDDKNIVHRQGFFDKKPGVVMHPVFRPEEPPDPAAEHDGSQNVAGGKKKALTDADFAFFFMKYAQVECQ